MYNRQNLKPATASLIGSLLLSNSMLLYPGTGSSFVTMIFTSAVATPLYYYSLIPFFTLLALIIVNYKGLIAAFSYRKTFASLDEKAEQT
jgi:hypothetical protein